MDGNLDYAAMLLDSGIDPQSVNSEGRSLLYAAIYSQRQETIDWLLSKVSFSDSDILRVDICHRTVIDEIKFLESKRGDTLLRSRFPSFF